MLPFIVLAASLLILHGPDGQEVRINPEQVTSLRSPHDGGHFPPSAKCMVNLTDGKYVAVAETCAEVTARLRGEQ